jgi:hypothetical protein
VLDRVPTARLTGHPTRRLPAGFTFAGTSGEAVLLELERRGVSPRAARRARRAGDEPSHVLVACGIAEVAQTSVRFTFGHAHRSDLTAVADAVAASVAAVRSGVKPLPDALVTVIVPGRDVAGSRPKRSRRAQTFAAWRAILVDDGSIDATSAQFADAAASDPRFTVVRHETPRGLGAARNAGLDLVTTPLVGFLDADDVMTPRALERLVGALDRERQRHRRGRVRAPAARRPGRYAAGRCSRG